MAEHWWALDMGGRGWMCSCCLSFVLVHWEGNTSCVAEETWASPANPQEEKKTVVSTSDSKGRQVGSLHVMMSWVWRGASHPGSGRSWTFHVWYQVDLNECVWRRGGRRQRLIFPYPAFQRRDILLLSCLPEGRKIVNMSEHVYS